MTDQRIQTNEGVSPDFFMRQFNAFLKLSLFEISASLVREPNLSVSGGALAEKDLSRGVSGDWRLSELLIVCRGGFLGHGGELLLVAGGVISMVVSAVSPSA